MLLWILPGFIALIIANRAFCLCRNYIQARKIGLPIIIAFESWQDPFWMLLSPYVGPVLARLGLYNPNRDLSTFFWTFYDRNDTHAKLGPAFSLVSPFKTNIMVSDMTAARELTTNWRYWPKSKEMYSIFGMFGENVNTSNYPDWQRHRRITTAGFSEANFNMVWECGVSQAEDMKKIWNDTCAIDSLNGITMLQIRLNMNKLAIHVLSYAAMGKSYPFAHGASEPEAGHKLSFAATMETILDNVSPSLVVIVFSLAEWPAWLLSKSMRELQLAVHEFRQYLREDIENERQQLRNGTGLKDTKANDNLMRSLVRANEAARQEKEGAKMVLSDQELYGNLFMTNVAGYETTAGSLTHAMGLLAIYPEIQAWCQEEIDAVLGENEKVSYLESYPKLVRLRALQYETVRFFSPISFLSKYSSDETKTLTIRGKEYIIPPHTYASSNFNAIHFDPEVWGLDVKEFRPMRWVNPGVAGQESFNGNPNGADEILWSIGPRVCPGKKFSQVEFASAMATMLRTHSVKPTQKPGESMETARKWLEEVLFDEEFRFGMKPRRPEQASVLFVPRA